MLREVASNCRSRFSICTRRMRSGFLSYFDPLTGLAKRCLFCERVARLLARQAGEGAEVLVVAFDIERLGSINDSFGGHVGDQVVQFVADSVKSQFEGTECLAHLDGDNCGRDFRAHLIRGVCADIARAPWGGVVSSAVGRRARDPDQREVGARAVSGKRR